MASLNSLKILDLNLNSISQIEGLERIQLEELYLSHNHIREILPIDLPSSLKVLNLRKNSIASVQFLSKVPGLESLNIEDNKLVILHHLKINNGALDLGDKSPAESIYTKLKMSKKNFKRTIGGLYKDRIITVGDFEIKLIAID